MGYKEIIENQYQNVYNASIATKIIQHMDRVRDNKTEELARRWVWELIQNAKDVSYADSSVKVKISLYSDRLDFSHNGKNFRIKDILSIINQVSSKKPDTENETTGKFGTGFITTHQLSEKVNLSGILQDTDMVNGEEKLTPKRFTVELDRSGHNQDEIMQSIDKAIKIIAELDGEPDTAVNPEDFNTTFSYVLSDKESFESARKGVEDIKHSFAYVLAFVKNLSTIIIEDKINNTEIKYSLEDSQNLYKDISILTTKENIKETSGEVEKLHRILLHLCDGILLAAPISENNEFLPIDELVPRIFVDFPLIGSEKFPFPVVCNSRNLLPNEPRSWIPLSENESSMNSKNNKNILEKARDNYIVMIKEAANCGFKDFYNALYIPKISQETDVHKEWYYEKIIDTIVTKCFAAPIIYTQELGHSSLTKNLCFAVSGDLEEAKRVWNISNYLGNIKLPNYEDLQGWNKTILSLIDNSTIDNHCLTLDYLVQTANSRNDLSDEISYVSWVQLIYDAVLENSELKAQLESGLLRLIPDQSGYRTLHAINNVFIDNNIDEKLKHVVVGLNSINFVDTANLRKLDIYGLLVNKDFKTRGLIGVKDYNIYELIDNIKKRSDFYNRTFSGNNRAYFLDAWLLLVSCHPDKALYDLCKTFFKNETERLEYSEISNVVDKDLWYNSIKGIVYMIAEKINTYGSLELFVRHLFSNDINTINTGNNKVVNENKTMDFLNKFYELAKNYNVTKNLNDFKVFPNQVGTLCSNVTMYRDIGVDEEIKIVSELISKGHKITNCREYLLDTRLVVDKTVLLDVSDISIANEITTSINNVLNSGGLSNTDEYMQEACAVLLAWIQENEIKARRLFSSFVGEEQSMKLLTPKSASLLTKQNKKFKDIMKNMGADNIEDFEKMLLELESVKALKEDGVVSRGNVSVDNEYLIDLDEEAREAYIREIGLTGERESFKILINHEVENGCTIESQTERECYLVDANNNKIHLFLADSLYHKQSGYDIKREVLSKEEVIETQYFEVKTTVLKEKIRYISLSKSQVKMAIKEQGAYSVICLNISRDLQRVLAVQVINNFVESISNNKISFIENASFSINNF